MSLEKALSEAISTIPECLAAGYVDMSTGMLLGVKTVDSHPQEILDMVAAATADLFQGTTVVAIEDHFKTSRGLKKDDSHYFQEIVVFSDNLIHVFLRTKKYPDHVIAFVSRKNANIGMVLTKTRLSVAGITDAV
ncbi:MAG: hypothetical protein BA874_10430 [Desulfuromonadales bacterium C00003068]|jgi:hypothetical protein|nr:MAG: hypothetical protein BA874_10430 [Desulfuromonadales bacterium C00003068]